MEFKDLLSKRRAEKNLTLEEIGKRIGVTKATVQRWESGEIKNIRSDNFANLAKLLDISVSYLVDSKNNAFLLEQQEEKLLTSYRSLNTDGQGVLTDYADYLVSSGRYKPYKKVELKKPHKLIAFGGDNEDTTYHGTKIDKKPKIT